MEEEENQNEELYMCDCGTEINNEEYEMFDGMCEECHLEQADW